MNPIELEEAYKDFTENFSKWVPDGVIPVGIKLLQELDLLDGHNFDHSSSDELTSQFHVIETPDKVTLFNEQFAIWIVPQAESETPSTITLIALIHQKKPHLEIVFSTSGVYNSPRYILKVLHHFLNEVLDTEAVISSIGKKK